MKDAINNEVW